MKRRECKLGTPSTDLLVCFPSRAHLALMPKPICSPSRPPEPIKHRIHRRKKSIGRGYVASGLGQGQAQTSLLIWSKSKQMGSDISEPTSPKVTCAGQIKVRPRARPGNWQLVMEEIEKLHSERKQKRPSWVEAIGIKKDAMQFLSCLRNIKFDFRCFGTFPTSHVTSDDEDDDDDEEQEEEISRTVFSKWFMVLQENQENQENVNKDKCITTTTTTNITSRDGKENKYKPNDEDDDDKVSAPPSNALLLMRCRSAPAKRWIEEIEENRVEEEMKEKEILLEEELEMKKKKNMVVMRYYEDDDFYKISSDIAKETWVVGGIKDQLSRSRSWKR